MSKKASPIDKRARYGYVFILPLIIGALIIFVPNLIQTFRYSIANVNTMSSVNMSFSGFSAYKEALTKDPQFIPLLISNIKGLAVRTPVILIYSLFISVLLNQKFKGRVLARIVFFIPVILATGVLAQTDSTALYYTGSGQAIDTGTSAAMSSFSDLTGMLSSLDFPKFLINIVTGSVADIYSIASLSGLQIFIFLAGLQEIPTSLYEAAQTEGCTPWQIFWKITFPMISPQIAVNMVYTIAVSAAENNSFLTYSNQLAFNQNKYSLATSMNIMYLFVLTAVVMIMFIIFKRVTPRDD